MHGHMGLVAAPGKDIEVSNKCGPVFMHLPNPSTKEIVSVDIETFPAGSLYPLGSFQFVEVAEAYKAVTVNKDAEYDILKTHCALLIRQMMCHLEIPLVPEMLDWTAQELMRTEEDKENIMTLIQGSANFVDLGVDIKEMNENQGSVIRSMVEYDAHAFECPAIAEGAHKTASASAATASTVPAAGLLGLVLTGMTI